MHIFTHISRSISISIIDKNLGTVGRLLLQGHVDRNEKEDNRRVSSCPQSTTSESLAMNMTQQTEMRAIGKTTEMARPSL